MKLNNCWKALWALWKTSLSFLYYLVTGAWGKCLHFGTASWTKIWEQISLTTSEIQVSRYPNLLKFGACVTSDDVYSFTPFERSKLSSLQTVLHVHLLNWFQNTNKSSPSISRRTKRETSMAMDKWEKATMTELRARPEGNRGYRKAGN